LADWLLRYHVEDHDAMQLRGVHPFGSERFTLRNGFLLGGCSVLQIFLFLLRNRIERLDCDIAAAGPWFLVMSYFCKVSVYSLLSVYLLNWRDLTDNKNQLAEAMRAIKAGTPACE
jgi:hypothetical protein